MSNYITIIQNLVDDLPDLKEKWRSKRVLMYQLTAYSGLLKQLHKKRTQELLQHDPALSAVLASSMAMEEATEEMREELTAMPDGPVSTDQLEVFLDPQLIPFRKPLFPA